MGILRHVIVLAFGMASPLVGQADSQPLTWNDGLADYEDVRPIAGWILPIQNLDYATLPEELVKRATKKLGGLDLVEFATGIGDLKQVPGFLLLEYRQTPHGMLFWKGKRREGQRVLPRVWSGDLWDPVVAGVSESDEIEFQFATAGRGGLFVLVDWQGGGRDATSLRTEFLRIGMMPSVRSVIESAFAKASVVVHVPKPIARIPDDGLDCLKGFVTKAELRRLMIRDHVSTGSMLVFLRGEGPRRRWWFSCADESFLTEERVVSLRSPISAAEFRWDLTRSMPGSIVRLAQVAAGDPRSVTIELAVGAPHNGWLFTAPRKRHQRDGGEPLFAFWIKRNGVDVPLVPLGRFGDVSFSRADPGFDEVLDCAYRFIDCGRGVVKLVITPRSRPWSAEVRATWSETYFGDAHRIPVLSQVIALRVE